MPAAPRRPASRPAQPITGTVGRLRLRLRQPGAGSAPVAAASPAPIGAPANAASPAPARASTAARAPAPAAAAAALAPLLRAQHLLERQDWPGALQAVEARLRQAPHDLDALNLQAIAHAELGHTAQAENAWRALLAQQPHDRHTLSNLGRLLQKSGRLDEALTLLQRAVAQHPDHADAHLNLGVALAEAGRHAEALQSYRSCLALQPAHAQALFNLGKLQQDLADHGGAIDSYERALAANPRHAGALANLGFVHHYGAWFDPTTHRDRMRRLAAQAFGTDAARPAPRPHDGPLRVGLVSADFNFHPVGFFLASVLPWIDRERLHLVAYDNRRRADGMTAHLSQHCAAWHDISRLNDAAVAQLIAQDGIDVLIDLSGFTEGHRLALFAARPAPLQVSWLGYFATTGMPAIDYVLADPHCVPPGEEALFVERVWRLPATRFCLNPPTGLHENPVRPAPMRARGQVRFGCFQNLAKINRRVLQLWRRVLTALPEATLRLQSRQLSDAAQRAHFNARLDEAGLPLARIELAGGQSFRDYLDAHHDIDMLLDTFPYPGGTTTAEALWMGVPTISLALPGMLGRQGQGILTVAGLSDWVAQGEDDYLRIACHWAARPAALDALRRGLRAQVAASPLFDGRRFAADLADALWGMWRQSFPDMISAQAKP